MLSFCPRLLRDFSSGASLSGASTWSPRASGQMGVPWAFAVNMSIASLVSSAGAAIGMLVDAVARAASPDGSPQSSAIATNGGADLDAPPPLRGLSRLQPACYLADALALVQAGLYAAPVVQGEPRVGPLRGHRPSFPALLFFLLAVLQLRFGGCSVWSPRWGCIIIRQQL